MEHSLALYITISIFAFAVGKIVIGVLCYRRWKIRKQGISSEESFTGGKLVLFRSQQTKSVKPSKLLNRATKLGNKDIIGFGGYGTVYKLVVDESISFAVKRINRLSAEQERGFERELEAMGDIKHRNILTLHGYYTAPRYNFLLYELMPNGSLDARLHGGRKSNGKEKDVMEVLDWESRYKIAVGTARGISYLHHDCVPRIIHRDIKSSNILLDHNLEACVSDFGLATLMGADQSHVSTLLAGTLGYLPPEYFDTGKVATAKGDVYSFGVVLLELLTGRKPSDLEFMEEGTKLVTWVKSVVEEKREEDVLDSNLGQWSCRHWDQINSVFNISMMCLETDPCKRPTMAEVVKMLEADKTVPLNCTLRKSNRCG